ncbi:hypothetical protein [Micromonospora sp. NPDC049679]|uniref:hypothetical protein n=1 Tax=Micromonospora sp. NPDC049679 TaxID=3155920 RepID=UPI0033D89B25
MSLLGLLFLLVVLAQPLADNRPLSLTLTIASWLLWAVFIGEFILRMWAAPDRRRFLRRNWWQIILLVVPFLQFIRILQVFRVGAVGRGITSSVVGGSNSAASVLSGRIARLTVLTLLVFLAASHLLYATGAYTSYADALHDTAFTTISQEPLDSTAPLSQVLEIVLAAYSVIVFATLAGSIGAFFLSGRKSDDTGGGR